MFRLAALQRYVHLLAQPGYVGIVLDNNGLTPTQSSKLKVGGEGLSAEIRGGTVRFLGRKDLAGKIPIVTARKSSRFA